VAEHEVEVVIAAERVVPREPVHDDGRAGLEEGPAEREGLLACAEHALRVLHALGCSCGARREEDLRDGVGADGREGRIDVRARGLVEKGVEGRGVGADRFERERVPSRVVGEHEAGLDQVEDGAELGEVPGQKRVRR
jgi:hypothetical protein